MSDWHQPFLTALAQTGSVTRSAAIAGVTPRGAWKAKGRNSDFASAWAGALEGFAEARRAGLAGRVASLAADDAPHWGARGPRLERVGGRMTPREEDAFFGELATSASVRRAAAAAGVTRQAVYQRRIRDAEFAERWAGAVESGYARIELLLIERAGAALERGASGGDDGDPGAGAGAAEAMTVAEALALLRLGQRQKERLGQRGAAPVRVASPEETIAALAKRLAVFGGRVMAERAEREGQGVVTSEFVTSIRFASRPVGRRQPSLRRCFGDALARRRRCARRLARLDSAGEMMLSARFSG